jgi:hypothetical protein
MLFRALSQLLLIKTTAKLTESPAVNKKCKSGACTSYWLISAGEASRMAISQQWDQNTFSQSVWMKQDALLLVLKRSKFKGNFRTVHVLGNTWQASYLIKQLHRDIMVTSYSSNKHLEPNHLWSIAHTILKFLAWKNRNIGVLKSLIYPPILLKKTSSTRHSSHLQNHWLHNNCLISLV